MSERSLKSLTIALRIGGIWDAFMGFSFIFVFGTGRLIHQPPPLDLFYAVFLGSFFLCFAYLDVRRAGGHGDRVGAPQPRAAALAHLLFIAGPTAETRV